MVEQELRIAVFASGNGTNAENLIKSFNLNADSGIRVTLVVTNRSGAGVIERAKRLGVPVEYVPRDKFADSEHVLSLLDTYGADAIVLAGFLLKVPDYLLKRFPDRIINIHPSLLPKYGGKGMYGARVHRAVIESGDRESGITIHLVNEEYDSGRILFQATVPVEPTDTPEDVEHKIHELEQAHFPRVVSETLMRFGTHD